MTIDTDQLQLCVTRSHNLLYISATANYTVWTPIVTTVAIRSHNCLLTPIVGEGNAQ